MIPKYDPYRKTLPKFSFWRRFICHWLHTHEVKWERTSAAGLDWLKCRDCGREFEGLLLVLLLFSCSLQAATLKWEDTNNAPGTSYFVSNKTGTTWQFIGGTTNKQLNVTPFLLPGTNTFSLVSSNGLLSDPASTSTNMPFKVFNIIIEGRNELTPETPWEVETNLQQFVATIEPKNFYRIRAEIK